METKHALSEHNKNSKTLSMEINHALIEHHYKTFSMETTHAHLKHFWQFSCYILINISTK